MKSEKLRRLLSIKFLALLFAGLLLLLYILNDSIVSQTSPFIYTDSKTIPSKKAALLLGTAKYFATGQRNYFYTYRIRAAAELFKKGKVRAIVISGDNSTKRYDEPTTMKNDLIALGVPARYITLDYAGFRTLDSIVRAREIFGLDDYIIISQRFHLERALYIAHARGHKAIGFVAKDIPGTAAAYRMLFREYLARGAAFADLHILYREPRFLGKQERVLYRQ